MSLFIIIMATPRKTASGMIDLLYLIVVMCWLPVVACKDRARARYRGTTHHVRTLLFFA